MMKLIEFVFAKKILTRISNEYIYMAEDFNQELKSY